MMTSTNKIPPSWLILGLQKSHLVLGMMIGAVTQEQAQQLTDGPDGWSILEIMCHVRDHQDIYFERVQRILAEDHPELVAYDRMAMVTERDYAHQNFRAVFRDFINTRERFIGVVSALDERQWNRIGIHPEVGMVDVRVPTYHTILHDTDHAEQVARVLGRSLP